MPTATPSSAHASAPGSTPSATSRHGSTRCTSSRSSTLEHRSAQHRRFAIEIVRGMGAGTAEAEQIGIAAEQEWGDPSNFELFPDVDAAARGPARQRAARSASSRTPTASSRRSRRSSGSAWTSRSPRARTVAASPARRSSPPRSRSAARRPQLAVMVGDSLDDDIAGAIAPAGCAPCSSIATGAIPTTPASASAASTSCRRCSASTCGRR